MQTKARLLKIMQFEEENVKLFKALVLINFRKIRFIWELSRRFSSIHGCFQETIINLGHVTYNTNL